jgi:hypothetical protein
MSTQQGPTPEQRAAKARARLRQQLDLWVEYKRLHLGFSQALNSLTYGNSSTLALIKHAMLAEYEARKLTGEEPEGAQSLVIGEAMAAAIKSGRLAYARVTSKAFDDKALLSLADEPNLHLIQVMLTVTTAPFDTADLALVNASDALDMENTERARRFTPEIRRLNTQLRSHFTQLAKRAGLA